MSVLEKPSAQKLKEIERIMFNFIWDGKRDKIKRTTMKNNYHLGGLKVPDPAIQADSLKMTWIKKFLNENNNSKWKRVMQQKLRVGESLSVFECNLSQTDVITRFRDKFWQETIQAWQKVASSGRSDNISGEHVLYESLWLNKAMKLEENPSIPKNQLIKRGLLQIKDMYHNEHRRLSTTSELANKYKFGHFLMWQALLKTVPREWKHALLNEKPRIGSPRSEIFETLESTCKTARWSYPILLKACKLTNPLKAQAKWERDLRKPQLTWPPVYKALYDSTDDVKLKWLQLRILHRILPTNRLLFLYGIKDSEKCERCSEPSESILHVFWDCNYSRRFWVGLQRKLLLVKPFTSEDIILGMGDKNGALAAAPIRMCVLLGKYFIWQCKANGSVPDIERFTVMLIKYVSVERFVAVCRGMMKKFVETYGDVIDVLECVS